MAVVRSQVEKKEMKSSTAWNIEVFDEAMQSRNEFHDDAEAIAWRRSTQKDVDEEWRFTTSEMEKESSCKHDTIEDKWKDHGELAEIIPSNPREKV